MTQVSIPQALAIGMQHHQAGELQQAEAVYRQILTADPNQPDSMHLLGLIAFQCNQPEPAIQLIQKAISINSKMAVWHRNLAKVLTHVGRIEEATQSAQRAVELEPQQAESVTLLGELLMRSLQFEQAESIFRTAAAIQPESADIANSLANSMQCAGKFSESIVEYHRAIALRSDYPEAWNNLANAHRHNKEPEKAAECFDRALQLRPDYAEALSNLGNLLQDMGQLDQAIDRYRRALQTRPDLADIQNCLGTALRETGDLTAAIEHHRAATQLQPNLAAAHHNLGLALLQAGEFAEGWREYEWRWRVPEYARVYDAISQPRWMGEALDGRQILIHDEQGFGDTLQFVRYIPEVIARGGKVILACQPELVELMKSVAGSIKVVRNDAPFPPFDLYAPLLSLPMIFNTTAETVPATIPYLHPDPLRTGHWRERLTNETKLKIGITWAGRPTHANDRARSIGFAGLLPLFAVESIRFFSLQKGTRANDWKSYVSPNQLTDWTADLTDFAESAAFIENLDLVITVDSAAAHLTGAIGKKAWVLIPFAPDWRWLNACPDSDWYPSIKLFRQPAIGDWKTPVEQLAESLRELAGR